MRPCRYSLPEILSLVLLTLTLFTLPSLSLAEVGAVYGAPQLICSDFGEAAYETDYGNSFNPTVKINDNGVAVWSGYDGSHFQIYRSNGQGAPENISNNTLDNYYPWINNNGWVVWYGVNASTNDYQIYEYTGSGSPQQISSGSTYNNTASINNNGEVVWFGYDGNDWEIYRYTGSGPPQNTSNNSSNDATYCFNDNGQIVWYNSDEDKIYVYSGSGSPWVLPTSSTDNTLGWNNNNNWIVYGGYDGNDYEIYVYKGSGTPVNLSDNSYDDDTRFVLINNNNMIFWVFSDGMCFYDGSTVKIINDTSWYYTYGNPSGNNAGIIVWDYYNTDTVYCDPWRTDGFSNSVFIPLANNGESSSVFSEPWINNQGQIIWASDTGIWVASPLTLTQVTNNDGAYDIFPQVKDDCCIVWQGWDGHDYEICKQLPGQDPLQLTSNETADAKPQMNAAGHTVWQNWDGSDWEVWYDVGSGPVQLTNNTGLYDVLPQISANDKIYWQSYDGNDYEVCRYDPATQTTTQLTNNSVADVWVQVNQSGQVTWMEYDGSNWQVWYDLGSGPVQLTTTGANEKPLITDDGLIFWQSKQDSDYEIYYYNGAWMAPLTDNAVDDITPAVKSGVLVWSQWDGQDYEIYRMFLNSGIFTRLTDDQYDDKWPRINCPGEIVWQKWDGSDYELYLYK